MKAKRILRISAWVFAALLAVWGILFATDCIRAQSKQRPVFAVCTRLYLDGGSAEYIGAGYRVIRYVKWTEGEDNSMRVEVDRVDVGPLWMKFDK